MVYNTKVVSRYKVFLKVKLTSPLMDEWYINAQYNSYVLLEAILIIRNVYKLLVDDTWGSSSKVLTMKPYAH